MKGLVKLNSDVLQLVSLLNEVDDGGTNLDAGLLADLGLDCVEEGAVAKLIRVVEDQVDEAFIKRRIGL